MRHVIRSAFLVSLPLMVLGCAGDSPLGLDENASPPLLDMRRAPLGIVSGKVTCCDPVNVNNRVNFNIQIRRVPNGKVVGVIEFSTGGLRSIEPVTCLVIDGNLAWANTVVTSGDLFPPGQIHTWIFRDGPDALQAEFVNPLPGDCTDKPPVEDFTDAFFVPVIDGDLVISAGT